MNCFLAVPKMGDSTVSTEKVRDEQVIASVTAGLALCGVVVGRDGSEKLEKPRKQVLRMPADCKLKAPSQEYVVRSGIVTDLSSSEQFFETVSVSGWSVALKVATPGDLSFLAGGEMGVQGRAEKLAMRGTALRWLRKEVWKMECHYVPRASFQIHHSQMRLSEEALEDVRGLRTLGDAKAFLHNYGSHVPDREYHVGGILLLGAGVRSRGATELSTLIDTASRQLPGITAGISMLQVGGARATGSVEKSQASTAWRKDESSNLYMRAYVRALGPPTAKSDEFLQRLAADRSTWFIVDVSEDADLVPVWDVVGKEDGESFQTQMKLLHTAWQISRSLLAGYLDDHALKSSSSSPRGDTGLLDGTLNNVSIPKCIPKYMKKDQLLQQMQCWVLAKLYGDEPSSVPEAHSLQPQDIVRKLWDIYSVVTSSDAVFKKLSEHNATALLFQVPAFEELVTHVAQSTVPDMNTARRVLKTILNEELQQSLKEEGVTLSRPIEDMLALQNKHEEFAPVEVPVSPTGLPVLLKSIVTKFQSLPDDTSHHAPFCDAVEKVIKACIGKYQGEPECEKVKKVVKGFGFDEQGIFTVRSLGKDHVNFMIEELDESLQQQPNQPLPPPPSGIKHSMAPYMWPSKDCYSYNRDIVVDRALERNDVHERMIDCLRHRVDPFSSPDTAVKGAFDFSDSWGEEDAAGFGEPGGAESESDTTGALEGGNIAETSSSPFRLLVRIMQKSDLTFQMTLSKLLLEQRIAVPLVLPQNGSRLGHILESLRYVEVKTTNQKLVSIYDDNKLPRVIFASRRKDLRLRETAAMASEVLGCHFVSQHCDGELQIGPVLELGVGFYPDTQPGQHLPCLAFCVWGELQRLTNMIRQLGDPIVVLECNSGSHKAPIEGLGSIKHLYWETNSSRNGLDKKNQALSGSFKYVAAGIRQYLKVQCAHVIKGSSIESPRLEMCLSFVESLQPVKHSRIVDENFNSSTTMSMKSELQLQKSYAREAKFQFEAARIRNNPPERKAKERAWQEERRKRQHLSAQIFNLPVLKLFVELLSYVDPVFRRLSIVQIQRYFDHQNRMNFETAAGNVDMAFETFQSAPADAMGSRMLHDAKTQNVERMLGMEHLWRELCHVFIADPTTKGNIPTLAAHHLLDGFPLEILDGEAGMYCKPWVDRVLVTLDIILTEHLRRDPRVFVMSVVGLQSSGKSTLLNTMFGTGLQTSAGRCTRGVYLQLVKSDRDEYDYVLLLDTEGIRAPEFFGLEGSEAHDNRLATFAVLPADACVVVVSNEDDSGLKEVLSMVMLAYKGSAMAMNSGGWMPSKLFFVYRSIDTNDRNQLRSNQLKLQEHLQRAASEAAGSGLGSGSKLVEVESLNCNNATSSGHLKTITHSEQITADDLISSVINFRVHQDEDKSDVKYLGNLKKENMPPGDIPDWAYGTKVMEIREYIHKRVTEKGAWRAHSLTDWSGYLGMVWKCIATADFELSFKSLVEFSAFEELTNLMESHRRAVTKKYDEEFVLFERSLRNRTVIMLENPKVLTSIMLDNVESTIKQQTVEVQTLLANPRWQKWKLQEMDHWREYLHESRFHWSGRCEGSAGMLEFENVVRSYYQKLQLQIKELFKAKKIVMNHEHPEPFQRQVDMYFKDLFQRMLQQVREEHKPLADKVPKLLTSVYSRSAVARLYDFQADEWSILQADVPGYNYASASSSAGGSLTPSLALKSFMDHARGNSRICAKESDSELRKMPDEELRKMVDRCLEDALNYSDHIVEDVIQKTSKVLSLRKQQNQAGIWGSKTNQQNAHIRVKSYLTERLCAIQQRWDAEYNVARKLEQEKDRLRSFFVCCANEVGGSEMLALAIIDVLDPGHKSKKSKNIMIEAFKPIFIKEMAEKLETQEWLSNATVFRALLDLHLLNLAEGGRAKEAELLKWTANGRQHYEFLMNTLMERELIKTWRERMPWESFLGRVKTALNHAAVAAETTYQTSELERSGSRKARLEHSGLKLFLDTLYQQLHSTVSKDLATAISSLSADVYDNCNLDYGVIESNITYSMDTSGFMPDVTNAAFKAELVTGVRDCLVGWKKSGARPRCPEACPKCRLTCYKAVNHFGLHDTLHQPKGLVGVCIAANTKNGDAAHQLSCTSCSRAVSRKIKWEKSKNQRSFFRSKWAKYKDFSKYYPAWAVPNDAHGQCASVREYIFYNHQEGLVKTIPNSRICTDMPPEYNHDPKELRIELENILKKHFRFQDSQTII